MYRKNRIVVIGLLTFLMSAPAIAQESAIPSAPPGESRTIAKSGVGFLELVNGYRVLHVKGTPYDMGFQQGTLLRDEIRELVHFLFDVKAKEFQTELKVEVGGLKVSPDPKALIKGIADGQRKFVPARYFEEMRGIADGAGMPVEDVIVANFIPEMFHCSGFALCGKATVDGKLYHGRVLDYGVDWRLQEHAVVTVAEPEGRNAFVNVTFAGFVGSVTGMNAESISIGEMGGKGLGHWAGVPMAILVRMALEEADSLEEAVGIFRDSPRTCEYYYVVADGETGKAVGMEASWHEFGTVAMGESHPLLPRAVPDAVLLSAGDRYDRLVDRVELGYGKIDAAAAIHLMDRPVAMKSNLHNVLFEPKSTRFWVANASAKGEPAATQPYYAFQLTELLSRRADAKAAEVAGPSLAPSSP
jgi:isopenicillin-N N-acyltransferase like protein